MRALLRPVVTLQRCINVSVRPFSQAVISNSHSDIQHVNGSTIVSSDATSLNQQSQSVAETEDDPEPVSHIEGLSPHPTSNQSYRKSMFVKASLGLIHQAPDVSNVWRVIESSDKRLVDSQVAAIFSKISEPRFCSHHDLAHPAFKRLCDDTIALIQPNTRTNALRGWTGSVGRLYAEFPSRQWIQPDLVKLIHALVKENLNRASSIITDSNDAVTTFCQLGRFRREYPNDTAFWDFVLELGSQIDSNAASIPVGQLVSAITTFAELDSPSVPMLDKSIRERVVMLRHQVMIKASERLCANPDQFNQMSDYTLAELMLAFVNAGIRFQDNFFASCCTQICSMNNIRPKAARNFVLALSKAGIYHRGVYRYLARQITSSTRHLWSASTAYADATQLLHSYMRLRSWAYSKDITALFEMICLRLVSLPRLNYESISMHIHRLWALVSFDYQHQNKSSDAVKQCIENTLAFITPAFLEKIRGVDHCWMMLHECTIMNPNLFDEQRYQMIVTKHAELVREQAHRMSNHRSAFEWLKFLQPRANYDTDLNSNGDLALAPRNTVAIRKSDGAFVVLLHTRTVFLHEYEHYRILSHEYLLGCQLAQERGRTVLFIQRDFSMSTKRQMENKYHFYDATPQNSLMNESPPESNNQTNYQSIEQSHEKKKKNTKQNKMANDLTRSTRPGNR